MNGNKLLPPDAILTWIVIVIIGYFIWQRMRSPLGLDIGNSQSVRYDYSFPTGPVTRSTTFGNPYASNPDASFIPRLQHANPVEVPPRQPVVSQSTTQSYGLIDRSVRNYPFYHFIDQMFHSEYPAWLRRRSYP